MDLQGVNNSIIPRAPCVPDPHTSLNQLKPENAYFTVIDLANAFFSMPVHPIVKGGSGSLLWGANGRTRGLPRDFRKVPQFTARLLPKI